MHIIEQKKKSKEKFCENIFILNVNDSRHSNWNEVDNTFVESQFSSLLYTVNIFMEMLWQKFGRRSFSHTEVVYTFDIATFIYIMERL